MVGQDHETHTRPCMEPPGMAIDDERNVEYLHISNEYNVSLVFRYETVFYLMYNP